MKSIHLLIIIIAIVLMAWAFLSRPAQDRFALHVIKNTGADGYEHIHAFLLDKQSGKTSRLDARWEKWIEIKSEDEGMEQ